MDLLKSLGQKYSVNQKIDKSTPTIIAFLDLAEAFDTVDGILLSKLYIVWEYVEQFMTCYVVI